jgi:hypothetical protein
MNENIKLGLIGLAIVIGAYSIVKTNSLETELNDRIDGILVAKQANSGTTSITPPVNIQGQKTTPQSNQQTPVGPTTSVRFNEEVHNFGNVDVNTDNPYSFIFTNTGTEPLLITNAKGSCGCTVPSWPKDPIMPGATGKIDVVFRPSKGQAGKPQEKTVTVTANTEPVNTVVRIKAMVNPEAE